MSKSTMNIEQIQSLWLASLKSQYVSESTIRKYGIFMRQLAVWTQEQRLAMLDLTTLHLQQFLAGLPISSNTAHKRIATYKAFFNFSEENGFIPNSPARRLKAPRFKVPDRKPYTQAEIISILEACSRVGQHPYERLRAKAAVLLMRHHALRISDTLALRRDSITQERGTWILRLRAKKNDRGIEHPVPDVVLDTLHCLPVPIGVNGQGTKYFFWNGVGRFQNVMDNMQAILRDVYRASCVPGACNHRFRHTRASEILAVGGTMQDVADFLGISARIAEKHYCKWMPERQQRITALMEKLELREEGYVPSEARPS